jgi:hypothetical protein
MTKILYSKDEDIYGKAFEIILNIVEAGVD